ncbi:unnamed protein product [Closterium sp. NIES-53]
MTVYKGTRAQIAKNSRHTLSQLSTVRRQLGVNFRAAKARGTSGTGASDSGEDLLEAPGADSATAENSSPPTPANHSASSEHGEYAETMAGEETGGGTGEGAGAQAHGVTATLPEFSPTAAPVHTPVADSPARSPSGAGAETHEDSRADVPAVSSTPAAAPLLPVMTETAAVTPITPAAGPSGSSTTAAVPLTTPGHTHPDGSADQGARENWYQVYTDLLSGATTVLRAISPAGSPPWHALNRAAVAPEAVVTAAEAAAAPAADKTVGAPIVDDAATTPATFDAAAAALQSHTTSPFSPLPGIAPAAARTAATVATSNAAVAPIATSAAAATAAVVATTGTRTAATPRRRPRRRRSRRQC